MYALRFWSRSPKGTGGVGVYLQFFNAKGKGLNTPDLRNEIILVPPADRKDWGESVMYGKAPEGSAYVTVWVHSFNGSQGSVDFDDFSLSLLTGEEAKEVATSRAPDTRADLAVPDKARIQELAAMLPAEPQGVGRPASDRAAWDKLAELPEAASIIAGAEKYIDTPPPALPDELYLEFTKTGNRTHYQSPYGKCSGRIQTLLEAECLEYKGRFLKALERDVLAMCSERSWTMPAHDGGLTNFNGTLLTIDLGSSARGWLLSSVDYWLGDKLDAKVRARIREEVGRRIFTPYLTSLREGKTRGNWWMRGSNNWNAVCTAGVIGSALALVDSPLDRAEFLAGMENSIPFFLGGFTDDGYCSEGMGYWNYGFGHFMMLGLSVRAATDGKLDIFQGEKLERIAAYAKGYQIEPGRSPHFADGGGGPGRDIWALIRHVYPDAVPASAEMPSLLSGGHVTVGLRAFGQEPPPADPETDKGLPLHTWFADAQVLISRSGPDAETTFGIGMKGGHNAEHHNHNDVGSYYIVYDGTTMTGDPGGEIYTRRTFSRDRYVSKVLNSYGHPVPMVAGKLQSGGRKAAAEVLATEFSAVRDSMAIDMKAAYDVPELKALTRRFGYDRRARVMEVIDEAEFTTPQEFNTPIITYKRVFKADDRTLFLYDAKHCVRVRIGVEGGLWNIEQEEMENPGRPSATRLAVTFLQPVRTAKVRFEISPCELPDDLPGIYHPAKWGKLQPQPEAGVLVEAESPAEETGGAVTVGEKPGASGKAFKFWDNEGHALVYVFDVPKAGTYALQLRVCGTHAEQITRRVLVDGKELAGVESFILPDTGGWSSTEDDWQDVYLAHNTSPALVKLTAGKHVVKLVNDCGIGLNMDWLKLVPVQE
jgi:hypothetical protein